MVLELPPWSLKMPSLTIDYNSLLKLYNTSIDELNKTNEINELKVKSDSSIERLFYANQEFVKQLISSSNNDKKDENIDLIEGNTDLIANQYEGGFKLWEGLYDIIDYLSQFKVLENYPKFENLNVLEVIIICFFKIIIIHFFHIQLGCGSGLASIYVSKKLPKANIYLQDFNEQVIKYFTAVNVHLNHSNDSEDISRFNYMFGDWSAIADDIRSYGLKFDLILSSETLYNCDNYEKLVKVIKSSLSTNGSVYIASKSHYFGVGGGTYSFMDYLQNDGYFESDICHEIEAPLIRQILKINRKK